MHVPSPYQSPCFGDKLWPLGKIEALVKFLRNYPNLYDSNLCLVRLSKKDVQQTMIRLVFMVFTFVTLPFDRACMVFVALNLAFDAMTLISKQLQLRKIGLSVQSVDVFKMLGLRWLGNLEGSLYFTLIYLARLKPFDQSETPSLESVKPPETEGVDQATISSTVSS